MLLAGAGAAPPAEEVASLHQAVRAQDKEEIEKFKGRSEHLDAHNGEGYTALQEAIRYGHGEIARILIEFGADPNALDADGRSALHHTALSDEAGLTQLLIEKGVMADKQDPYKYTALHLAAREGYEKVVMVLLHAGANINAKIDVGFTAIDLADAYPSLQDYLRERGGKEGHELP